ncbi:N-alpha-acetlytransferase 50 (NAT5) [Vairimorpha necatrix]|uniref:N-alpha-acetlytransferase 50 (NAT5) n=1 Tax=Vairimorpha necatrix TaxID=6039 RepID=A0AAX4JC19_9MICR
MSHQIEPKIIQNIFLEPISSHNINMARNINNILFPLRYSPSFYEHILGSTLSKGFFFKYKNVIIGICSFNIKNNTECYIMTFGILEMYRNMGLGSQCIKILEEYVVRQYRVTYLRLHVHTGNIKGINFYKKNSYKIIKIEEVYYKNIEPTSAYILYKYM